MDHTGFLTGNLTLDLAILAWFAAQVLKTLLHWVTNRNLDLRKMIGSGNMPSSHSAFICAASASIGQVCGWRDPLFSLSAAIALVVMYDACNVRRAAGEQAKVINYVREQASMRITTGMLNSVLADAQTRVQPPTDKGRRLKIYYMTQVGIRPPHFVVFCNDKKLFHFSYRRYLENQIRSVFGLEGTPIIMTVRQKGEEDS